MIGALIGDLIGSQYRFANYKSKDFGLLDRGFSLTENGLMTLAVAKAVMRIEKEIGMPDESKELYFTGVGKHFLEQFSKYAIEEMQSIGRAFPQYGFGNEMLQWIFNETPKAFQQKDNSATFRISPVIFLARNVHEADRLVSTIIRLTDDSKFEKQWQLPYAEALFYAWEGCTKKEIELKLNRTTRLMNFTLDEIRPTYPYSASNTHTISQALVAFHESKSFEDALRCAISLGGDSAALASLTGALAEAYYGIPEWLRQKAIESLPSTLREICNAWQLFASSPRFVGRFRTLTRYLRTFSKEVPYDLTKPSLPTATWMMLTKQKIESFETDFHDFMLCHPQYLNNSEQRGLLIDDLETVSDSALAPLSALQDFLMVKAENTHAITRFFGDGIVANALTHLQNLDCLIAQPPLEVVQLSISGKALTIADEYIFTVENESLIRTVIKENEIQELAQIGKTVEELENQLSGLGLDYWQFWSEDTPTAGVLNWDLSIIRAGQRLVAWHGTERSIQWDRILHIFGIGTDYDDDFLEPISRVVIEVAFRVVLPLKESIPDIEFNYLERLTLDGGTGIMSLERFHAEKRVLFLEYDVGEGLDHILTRIAGALARPGWHDSHWDEDDTSGIRFYRIEAVYENGSIDRHEGVYNRLGVPEGHWTAVIAPLFSWMNVIGIGELLNIVSFSNALAEGEVKYCSVIFENGSKTYFYQTDDEEISIGDLVVVPVGIYDEEKEARVVDIAFYQPDKVPYPLEKTKRILRKGSINDIQTDDDKSEDDLWDFMDDPGN